MARPSKLDNLRPLAEKFKKFDEALLKMKGALEKEPAKLIAIGLYVGESQALFVDLNESILHYGFLESGDAKLAQIENALNEIELGLKEETVNVPLIGMNVGIVSIISGLLKDEIGISSLAKPTKATTE